MLRLCYAMLCTELGISGMGYATDDLNNTSATATEPQQQQQYVKNLSLANVHELIVPYRCTSSKPPDKNRRFHTQQNLAHYVWLLHSKRTLHFSTWYRISVVVQFSCVWSQINRKTIHSAH